MHKNFKLSLLTRKRKSSLALYQELISTGMLMIVQSLVLVSKTAQFKSYVAGLIAVRHTLFVPLVSAMLLLLLLLLLVVVVV